MPDYNLTQLAKRLYPFLMQISEGVAGGNQPAMITLIHTDAVTSVVYPMTNAGFQAALDDAEEYDAIEIPSGYLDADFATATAHLQIRGSGYARVGGVGTYIEGGLDLGADAMVTDLTISKVGADNDNSLFGIRCAGNLQVENAEIIATNSGSGGSYALDVPDTYMIYLHHVILSVGEDRAEVRYPANIQYFGPDQLAMTAHDFSDPPTAAEMDTFFGSPEQAGIGAHFLIRDDSGGTKQYFVWSDGTDWYFVEGTKAV